MAVNPQIKSLELRPPKAPNLLIAPVSYSQLYIDQLNNALRLYFNQIDNFGLGLLNGTGGAAIKFPYGAFHQDGYTTLSANMTNVSTTPIQVASTAGFPSAGYLLIESEIVQYTGKTATTFTGITRGVKSTTNVAHTAGVYITEVQGITVGTASTFILNYTDYSNGITISNDTRVNIDVDGLYNIQFSIQLLNYDTNDDNVTVWLKKNGSTDIPASASIDQVPSKHGSYPGATIMSLNFIEQFTAGEYFELYWHTDQGYAVVATYPPGTAPVHPASPSLIMTVTFVSAV